MVFEKLNVYTEGPVLFAKISAPPMNLLGPELVRDLVSLIQQAEADNSVRVLVFNSADPDYFISHVDVSGIGHTGEAAAKLTGERSVGMLFRYLSASRLVTIAQVEGRARGVGSEFVLACDLRFAARETAIFGQPEVGFGLLPGAGGVQHLTRVMGRARALEAVLTGEDYDADLAERYGWINRAQPASALGDFVRSLAHRIARFPAATLAVIKDRINAIALAPAEEFRRDADLFREAARNPEAQSRIQAAMKRGFQTRGAEMNLGQLLGELEGKSISKLEWKVLTRKRGSSTSQGIPPGKEHLAWVGSTVTLIYGQRDAVLVDTFLTEQHSRELVDWVVESGKNLVTIYVTHAHGDHYFGLKHLLDRFPNARAISSTSVVAAIREQIKPEFIQSFWEPRFPGQLPSQLIAPEALEEGTFYLEGEQIRVIELGHTDTAHSTALHVPSIGLVISGDCVYNDTHLYLAECDEKACSEWLQALDKIESLHPNSVVAGHGVLDPDSSPRHIEETRRYLRDFLASRASTSTARELYERMLSLHPDRVNPGSLWSAARASKPTKLQAESSHA
jgi:enoyl-CoA hydratase/carnithine racemase/glyoxylase-like metal-dependent hydrolase (beta-lactamase superfamily II)